MTPTFIPPTTSPTSNVDRAPSAFLSASELRQAIVAIQLVGPATIAAHTVALDAIRRTYPQLSVHRSRDLAEALTQPVANGPELMILLSPKTGEVDTAAATLDPRGLPRWSVITRGSWAKDPFSRFIGIAAEDWNATVLAHVLVYAAARPALERENVRLRGDLRTIGRRLAHDLRTPLNCISTASEALAEQFTRADSVEALMVQSISSSVTEAESLIERLSPVLLATATPCQTQTVAMDEVVWNTIQRLETRILKSGATVIQPPSWPTARGVPPWIDLIWMNLITNSLTHAGPQPRIELGWHPMDGAYCFWTRDSGKGVPPDKRHRLFHPLDRLNDLNAPRGYGLPIIQRLVELQGGRSGYDPHPAPGGTFFFTLPAA